MHHLQIDRPRSSHAKCKDRVKSRVAREPRVSGWRSDRSGSQRPSEAQLVAVGIGQVKEPLAPFGITRRGIGLDAGGHQPGMEGVDIGDVENQASPPGPSALGRLDDQVEIIGPGAKTGERRRFAAIEQLKSQHAVKLDGAAHVMRGERHGADAVDHERTAARAYMETGSAWKYRARCSARHAIPRNCGSSSIKTARRVVDYPAIDRRVECAQWT